MNRLRAAMPASLAAVAISLAAIAFFGNAQAQSAGFPNRAVRVVVPYAPGGGPDIQTRQFAEKFSEALGQQVVVENKIGAAGIVAAQAVAQAPADGYMLLIGSNTHLIQKVLQPKARFDPIADFVGVGRVVSSPTVLVVAANSPVRSLDDLVKMAKERPGKLNYGSGGIGTSAHLAGATFQMVSNIETVHVPLRGSVEIMPSLLRGDIDFAFPVSGTGVPQVKSGKLRALAVSSGKRLREIPDVPTLQELTQKDLTVQESWFGLWAPAGTPAETLRILHAAANRALADPALQAKLEATGGVPAPSESPAEFAEFIRKENVRWTEIVRISGAKSE